MQTPTVSDVGERALIERIRARLSMPAWVIVGPGDDAAVIAPERGTLDVFTMDAQIEGVHFDRRFVPPDAIGHRALAVNLSDLAAMGAQPRAVLLSLALPDTFALGALDGMLDGLLALATVHRVTLIGGNITRSPGPLVVDVTAIGAVRPRRILTRGGARPGDAVYVTGTLGDAAIGLRRLQSGLDARGQVGAGPIDGAASAATVDEPSRRYLCPEPRVRAGMLLGRNRAASSCMDLSDGLGDAVRQIAQASNVGMVLDCARLPISAAVRHWHQQSGGDPVETALSGGDDYELLFTVRPGQQGRLRGVRHQVGDLPISRIGVVTKDRNLLVTAEDGTRLPLPHGFEHFR